MAGRVHETVVDELYQALNSEMTGHDLGDLLHFAKPFRHFPIGSIFPEPGSGDSSIRPSSCGLSARLSPKRDEKAKVILKGHFYVRRRPTLKEQEDHLARHWGTDESGVSEKLADMPNITLPYCWQYVPFRKEIEVIHGESQREEDCTPCLTDAWKIARTTSVPYSDAKTVFNLTEAPGRVWESEDDYQEWLAKNFSRTAPNPEDDGTHRLIVAIHWNDGVMKVHAVNRARKPEGFDKSWFLVDQSIYITSIEIPISESLSVEPIESEVTDTFHATSIATSWGEGRNLQVRMGEDNVLSAEPFGLLRSDRTEPIESTEVTDLSFKTLSKDPLPSSESILAYLSQALETYTDLDKSIGSTQSSNSVGKMKFILERVSKGVEFLHSDENIFESFKLMNETFRRRYACKKKITSWRVFQFVYILGKLPHIVDGEEETYDVIFVPTGGGKTEAYFGFLITTMFYLRFRGVNSGTVAIVKFPLRMLAIDQIQRIAPLVAVADMVRRENAILGDIGDDPQWQHELSLGFMIGGTSSRSTPNRVHGHRAFRSERDQDDEADIPEIASDLYELLCDYPEEVKLFFECPVCRYREHEEGHDCGASYDTVSISYDAEEVRARHQCTVCGTRFALHWSDEECYRYLPSIIISTQDRVAYGAFAPHMRSLLGSPLYVCPDHGYSIYSNTCTPFKGKGGYGKLERKCKYLTANGSLEEASSEPSDRALRFVIQDEMHLLRSDLGSIDSPFEKMIAQVVFHYSGRKPQYIGMSATVQGVQKQVSEIYGSDKHVWLFPGDPPCKDFAKDIPEDAFFEHTDNLNRVFVGCMPSSEDPSTVVYRAMEIFTEQIFRWEKDLNNGLESLPDSFRQYSHSQIAEALRSYRVNLGFMRTKIDLERSKQNLENISNIERRKLTKIAQSLIPELVVDELTGDNTIKDIRDVIGRIKGMFDLVPRDRLDVLLATNLVSHGIDLEEMNIMVFYGIPGSTAEYLQAFSRVGRKFPGLILVVYHPRRARDRGLWRTFNHYHKALRQQVEMMPVDHLAPGLVDQTFITLLRNYWNLMAEPEVSPNQQGLYQLQQIVAVQGDQDKREILVDQAVESILKWLEWSNERQGDLELMIEDYLEALEIYHDTVRRKGFPKKLDVHKPPPSSYSDLYEIIGGKAREWMSTMTGIRGIRPGFTHSCSKFTQIYLDIGGV